MDRKEEKEDKDEVSSMKKNNPISVSVNIFVFIRGFSKISTEVFVNSNTYESYILF